MMWLLFFGVALLAITTECRYVYQSSIHGSLSQHKVIATWEAAQARCQTEGAELAVPSSTELLTAMTSLISAHGQSSPHFIGFRAKHGLGRYVSAKNVSLDDMPVEVTDMIDKIDPRDGDCLALSAYNISAVPCWSRLPFMCFKNEGQEEEQTTPQIVETTTQVVETTPQIVETTTEVIETTTQIVETTTEQEGPRCESDYIYYPEMGQCYKNHGIVEIYHQLYEPSSSWFLANDSCAEEGGYLNIINDQAEAEFIMNVIYPLNADSQDRDHWWMWTGLYDVGNGTDDWRSIHGEPMSSLYNNWDGFTSDHDVDPNCGTLHLGGQLRKSDCYEYRLLLLVLCEREPIFKTTLTTTPILVPTDAAKL